MAGDGEGFDGVIFAACAIDLVGFGVPFIFVGVDLAAGDWDGTSGSAFASFRAESVSFSAASFARGGIFSAGGGSAWPPDTADSSLGSAGLSSTSVSSAVEVGLSGFAVESELLLSDNLLILLMIVSMGGGIASDSEASGMDRRNEGDEDNGSSAIDVDLSDTAS